ncbi:MAG: carbamoyltransferase HypF [Planctomycetaceae bacterium]|nr:carbamoyltransferase HypF [Planctomycetaceae bacterium]
MTSAVITRSHFVITGQVQGVGFRPFVYRLAVECNLTGWVLNDARGVTLEVQGPPAAVDDFAARLAAELPPLATMATCERSAAEVITGEQRFEIRPSEGGELADAQITVDVAVCPDCLREMADPADPRHRYPFINCTNCGPRYSIVAAVPYDRPNTTMSGFEMCPLCRRQYEDPADRRFHAQPVACPECGPTVRLIDTQGITIDCDDAIAAARLRLQAGDVVAVKGLGGYQLACLANDEHAVGRLRRRKQRDAKPFALMVRDVAEAAELCQVSPAAVALLESPLRPIVIMPRRPGRRVAREVAHGLDTLGVMLPYTPLHHLLLERPMGPLVMTSGNYSEQPLVREDDEALSHLCGIADVMLVHNRPIERRVDDSVVQDSGGGRTLVLRRARGYAPQPLRLAEPIARALDGAPPVLAVGAELKNTFCLLSGSRALVSEHIGDLKEGRTYRHFIDTINHLEALFDIRPELLAADLHPQYLSSQYAHRRHRGELASGEGCPGGKPPRDDSREGLPIELVQHHHAHIVSCMAENGCAEGVIGIACDGVGYGDDGAIWGCEVLAADLQSYRRLGHLRYLPLIGGDAAAGQTWRPAVAALHEAFGEGFVRHLDALPLRIARDQLSAAIEQLTMEVNCPPSSSLGRWFDAVAWLCGVTDANAYEAQGPMLLESAIEHGVDREYPFALTSTGPFTMELQAAIEGIVADHRRRVTPGVIAAKFHNTLAAMLAAAAARARDETGRTIVALSGGCMANRYLAARLVHLLEADAFKVLMHRDIPCNDGGVALGQAIVAAARKKVARASRP